MWSLILIYSILFVCCISAQTSNATTNAREWSTALESKLKSLKDGVMKVPQITTMFDETEYMTTTIEAKDFVDGLAERLSTVLAEKEAIVEKLADRVAQLYKDSVGSEETDCTYLRAEQSPAGAMREPLLANQTVSTRSSNVKIATGATPSTAEICFSAGLDRTFIENAGDEVLPWQYFGSYTGYHRQFPAVQRPGSYDPRERPWYTGASSGSKAVVLVLDTSGSMRNSGRLELMKQAALGVLDSLTVDDYVNLVAFNSEAFEPRCAHNDALVRATPANVAFLKLFVNNLQANGQTNFYAAFKAAFDLLDRYEAQRSTYGGACRTAILFLTDGEPTNTEDHEEFIRNRNTVGAHVFTYALGEDATVQDDIACENQGVYIKIADGGNLRTKMAGYYNLFSLGARKDETFWTAPYVDSSGLGNMVTAARPVFGLGAGDDERLPLFLGVVGHDVRMSDFTALIQSFESGDSYAFLIDRQGNAIMHPRMSVGSSSTDAPVYQDITLLENHVGSAEFDLKVRQPMINGVAGSYAMTVQRLQDRGQSSYEGLRAVVLEVEYVWRPVGPFVFGYALAESDRVMLTMKPVASPSVPVSFYHRLALYDANEIKAVNATTLARTHPKYPGELLTFDASTFLLAPRAFQDPAARLLTDDDALSVQAIHAYVNAPPTEPQGNPGLREDGVRAQVRRLSSVDQYWVGAEKQQPAIGWLYLGTPRGVFRRYPGGDQKSRNYDPNLRPWFKRAVTFLNRLAVSTPYEDASGLGRVVTLAHSVPRTKVDPSTVGAVIGLDFTFSEFESLVLSVSPCAAGGSSGSTCVVIDSSGYVVYHPALQQRSGDSLENTFIGDLDASLAQTLVDAEFLVTQQYSDFRSQQECSVYLTDAAALDAAGTGAFGNACGSGSMTVAAVLVDDTTTNLYVLHLSQWRGSSTCRAPTRPACEPMRALSECETTPTPPSPVPTRRPPTCATYTITDELLEFIRTQDEDAGACGGLSTGAIVGIVFGVLIALCCCIVIGVILVRRYG